MVPSLRQTHLRLCPAEDVKVLIFLHDVPGLPGLVLVREGRVGDLDLQELAESVPALAHPVDQEVGGRHQGLHCCVVSPVLVQPHTLTDNNSIVIVSIETFLLINIYYLFKIFPCTLSS